jgi:hypothetical protein
MVERHLGMFDGGRSPQRICPSADLMFCSDIRSKAGLRVRLDSAVVTDRRRRRCRGPSRGARLQSRRAPASSIEIFPGAGEGRAGARKVRGMKEELGRFQTRNLLTVVRSAPLKDAVGCTIHPIFSASAPAPGFQIL